MVSSAVSRSGLTLAGMWAVIARSRKPAAQQLRRYMTATVMPSVCIRGGYVTSEARAAGVTIDVLTVPLPPSVPAAAANTSLTVHGSVADLLRAAAAELHSANVRAAEAESRALAAAAETSEARRIVADVLPIVSADRQLHDRRGRWKVEDAAKLLGLQPPRLRA